jgi:hypothetical protein
MTNAMYQLTTGDTILRTADNAFIPPDPANTDYAAYLQWLSEGNTPKPAPKAPRPVKLTPAEKLKSVGLTVEELKALLST